MKQKLGKKFWLTMVILSLVGQVAWVVENMYFNVFIYKMFHADAASISLMVAASAIMATLTTWLVGAFSDKVGKRKLFICSGYILWGISILSFALIRMDILTAFTGSTVAAASLGVSLVILMDCVMTFFGSAANDACYNAWLTDCGDETNRGRIEGINSMMPLVAILVVFGSFMAFNLDQPKSWSMIFVIIGTVVILIGILCCFLMEDQVVKSEQTNRYFYNLFYSFRPSVYRENRLLYVVVLAFAVFGISIQIFMPYLILYYEKSLGMSNYVLIMAPAIILAAVITAVYGKLYDRVGFQMAVVPTVMILMSGYVFLFFFQTTLLVFLGSLFMMTGYLTGMAVFGAMIRDHIPEDKAGLFQGLRIFGQVFIPGIIGPAIGAFVLKNAELITNSDGTTSFIPNRNIFLAAFVAAVILLILLWLIFKMIRTSHYILLQKESKDAKESWQKGETPWSEYPRPQFKRDSFYNLNGEWMLNGTTVFVPFPPQSVLSGYQKKVGGRLKYCKYFSLPEGFRREQVLLHFGAVDQTAEIFINGKQLYHHEGGYLPFSVDITAALKSDGENELLVQVTDKLRTKYPYGKQCKKRGGMWYTPVSGIWQTVWLESVPEEHIEGIDITPDLKGIQLKIHKHQSSGKPVLVEISIEDENISVLVSGEEQYIDLEQEGLPLRLWTPETPYLYQMSLTMGEDRVQSYFALRTIKTKEIDGVIRICLNDKPVFLHGVLDQGYFPDGIFLPADSKGYAEDILKMKELGFNTLRKHIKIEPETFYYDCDRYGMLVLQDMVNSGRYSFLRDTALPTVGSFHRNDHVGGGSRERKDFFRKHSLETVRTLYNHPCIVYYTIFNEGWGQFESDEMYELVKAADDSRIIDSTSGWFAGEKSDVASLHIYFQNKQIAADKKRPTVCSECGGYSYLIPNHFYSRYSHYGYGSCNSKREVTDRIEAMYREMIQPAVKNGLCGCIYTQLSDVEDEVNGLLTYDRKEIKVEEERLRAIGNELKQAVSAKCNI